VWSQCLGTNHDVIPDLVVQDCVSLCLLGTKLDVINELLISNMLDASSQWHYHRVAHELVVGHACSSVLAQPHAEDQVSVSHGTLSLVTQDGVRAVKRSQESAIPSRAS
jgi:hypothetical protein